MKTASAQQQFSLFALTIALIVLALAVFNWGLQYKMSLYQTSSVVAHSPAKLWDGKTISAAIANEDTPPNRSVEYITGSILTLLLFLRPKRTGWLCRLVIPWKLHVRAALRAFSFRPPPAFA